MKKLPFLLSGLLWTGGPLPADIVDDAGVTLEQMLRYPLPTFGRPSSSTVGEELLGIPLSEEHEAEIRAGLPGLADFRAAGEMAHLHEARGDFGKALERVADRGQPLDHARLLLRLGREAEARAVFSDEAVAALEKGRGVPLLQLLQATRPLEDAEAWDLLDHYLGLLLDRLRSPRWQAAVWQEQADVAWHRDRLPALLELASADKLRLAVIRDRMGETAECERLLEEIAAGADASRIVELMELFPASRFLGDEALARWGQADLTPGDRRILWPALDSQGRNAVFAERFLGWLRAGGDVASFADLIWLQWLKNTREGAARTESLEILCTRLPENPRFQLLLARQLAIPDVQRATRLFESVASTPLRKSDGDSDPDLLSNFQEPGFIGRDGMELDLALLGFHGLGALNRQDKIKEVIGHHPQWAALPLIDRIRYLAIGRMDHDLVNLILDADSSLPENATLARWLIAFLEQRAHPRDPAGSLPAGGGEDAFARAGRAGQEAEADRTRWRKPLRPARGKPA